jgi:drug/metabolite transporter (DMT)-like permease
MTLFGSATPVAKLVANDFPPFTGAGLRVAIGILILAPFLLARGLKAARPRAQNWLLFGLIALFGMFGFSVLMLFGMSFVSGVAGSIVMSVTPAVTALAAFLFLREPLGVRKATAIALAVGGVVVLQLQGAAADTASAGNLFLGSMLIFAAVCCEAAYTLLGKLATERASPLKIAFWAGLLSLPLFLGCSISEWQEVDWTDISWKAWASVLWWGAGTMGLGSLLWYAGVSKTEGSTAAGFMGLMPVSALLLSYLLLGEPFRVVHLIGFAIVFAGVVLIIRDDRKGDESKVSVNANCSAATFSRSANDQHNENPGRDEDR